MLNTVTFGASHLPRFTGEAHDHTDPETTPDDQAKGIQAQDSDSVSIGAGRQEETPKADEASEAKPARRKGGGGKLLAGFLAAFFLAFGGIATAIVSSAVNGVQQGQEVQTEIEKTAIGHVDAPGPDAAISKNREVFQLGVNLGYFNEQGDAFTAGGVKVGHADEQGNFYSVSVFPGKAIGSVDADGNIHLNYGLLKNPHIQINASGLSPQEKAAAALVMVDYSMKQQNSSN